MDNPQVLIVEEPPKPKWWEKLPLNKFPFPKLPLKTILITLVILIGLGVSLYLVQQKTNLLPKAFEPNTSTLGTIFRDDFENDLSKWKITTTSPNTAIISSDKTQSGSKSLKLHYQDGNKPAYMEYRFSAPQQGTVSIWFYDDLRKPAGSVVQVTDDNNKNGVILGVNPDFPNSYYYRFNINYPNKQEIDSKITRTEGWHKFEIAVTPKGSYGKIDDISLSYLPSAVHIDFTSFSKIFIISTWKATGDYYWDNLSVNKLPQIPLTINDKEKYFLEKFADITPDFTYINPADQGWTYRPKAIRALVLSVLKRNPQEIQEAKNLIVDLTQQSQYSDWGKHWLSPAVGYVYTPAAWFLWNEFSGSEKESIKNLIVEEADFWTKILEKIKNTPSATVTEPNICDKCKYIDTISGYINDTKAEENSVAASFLATAASMFPNHPNASKWELAAKTYGFHSVTTGETYNGITTKTVYYNNAGTANYLIDNHGWRPNPTYGVVGGIGQFFHAALYPRLGKQIPDEYKHNLQNVWDAFKPYINFSNYSYKNLRRADKKDNQIDISGQDDWAVNGNYFNGALSYLGYLSGNNQDLSDLLDYQIYVTRDYLAFPQNANVWFPGANNFYQPSVKYLLNGAFATSHLTSYILNDPTITLPIIDIPSPSPSPAPSLTPSPTPTSTPSPTLLFQDDFETDLNRWTITTTTPNSATISTDKSQNGSKALKLHFQDGNNSAYMEYGFSSSQQGTVSIWFYDDLKKPAGSVVQITDDANKNGVVLGVNPDYPNTYYYRFNINYDPANIGGTTKILDSKVTRTEGWHKFEIAVTPKGSYGKIDGISLNNIATFDNFINFSKIFIISTWNATGDYYWDNLQVQPN